jgi:hypothetical protein
MYSYCANSPLPAAGANKKASNVGHIKDGSNVSKVEGTIIDESISIIFKFLYHYMFIQQPDSARFL